jgi:hypothetical protein
MTWFSFLILAAVAAAAVILCALGIGLGVFLGRRRDIRKCSCSFDVDAAAGGRAAGRCCREGAPGGDEACGHRAGPGPGAPGGGSPPSPPPVDRPAAGPSTTTGATGGG